MLHDAELRSLAAGITSLSTESTHYNDQLQDLLERFGNMLRDYSAIRDKFEGEKTRQFKKQVVRYEQAHRDRLKRETDGQTGQTLVRFSALGCRWLPCGFLKRSRE
jgi:predicted  nucleic acid-binding Zn-ribbon protein